MYANSRSTVRIHSMFSMIKISCQTFTVFTHINKANLALTISSQKYAIVHKCRTQCCSWIWIGACRRTMRRKCDTYYSSRNGFVSSEQAFQCTALANAMQCIVMKMKTPKKRCYTAAANMVRVVLSTISAIHTCEVIVIDEKPQS